jgi:hypothetical protein
MSGAIRCNACGVRLQGQTAGRCPSCGADLAAVGLYREPDVKPWRAGLQAAVGLALAIGLGWLLRWWLKQ